MMWSGEQNHLYFVRLVTNLKKETLVHASGKQIRKVT